MHVGGRGRCGRQAGQCEVVGGEQRQRAVVRQQTAGDGPRQRQAVVGGCATADFVHQHQAVRRAGRQDGGRLGHFHHEGRASTRQIVGGADAGEDAVDLADAGARGGHETADARQQHDQRHLPHVGRFTAHVRAGDQQHAARRVQAAAVGREALNGVFPHRVAAGVSPCLAFAGPGPALPQRTRCAFADIGVGGTGVLVLPAHAQVTQPLRLRLAGIVEPIADRVLHIAFRVVGQCFQQRQCLLRMLLERRDVRGPHAARTQCFAGEPAQVG
ncbi:hypothetical protein G6F31_015709 [Rhizopus arrhizus]|nr:hypothetical protein G6F31_015709 [Rhizopus arrhizus]